MGVRFGGFCYGTCLSILWITRILPNIVAVANHNVRRPKGLKEGDLTAHKETTTLTVEIVFIIADLPPFGEGPRLNI